MGLDLRVIILVPAIAGCAIVGFVFALFLANAYLTVLQSTGAGAKSVVWAKEPVPDNLWKMFYVGGLVVLWIGPALLLGRAAGGGFASAAVTLLAFGLAFPVSQLSSLSGPTIWLPLWPDAVARMARRPGLTLGFYGLSVPVLAAIAVAVRWTFGNTPPALLVVGAPLLIVSVLVYARLLGRLAFALSFGPHRKGGRRPNSPAPRVVTPVVDEVLPVIDLVEDTPPPTAVPVLAEPVPPPPPVSPDEPPDDDPSRAATEWRRQRFDRSRRWDDEDDDATPYLAHLPEVTGDGRAPKQLLTPKPEDVRLLKRDDVPRRPRRVWSPDLLAFLTQPTTLTAILWLSALCGALGGFVRLAHAFDPTAD